MSLENGIVGKHLTWAADGDEELQLANRWREDGMGSAPRDVSIQANLANSEGGGAPSLSIMIPSSPQPFAGYPVHRRAADIKQETVAVQWSKFAPSRVRIVSKANPHRVRGLSIPSKSGMHGWFDSAG